MANEFELSYQGDANLYVMLRRSSDAKVWNASGLVTWNDEDLDDYAIPLTARGGDVYQGDFPMGETTSPASGKYRVLYYQRAGEVAGVDDLLLSTRSLYWNGQAVEDEPAAVEVDAYALTRIETVAAYLRLEDMSAAQTSLLASLVNQVSARIERICSRRFVARRWVERYAIPHAGQITLKQYPVLSVSRVLTGGSETVRVRYDASGALAAGVSVIFDEQGLSGVMRLTSTNAEGVETTTHLSLDTYTTTSSLVQAIEAVDGWVASITSLALTCHLHATGVMDVLNRHVGFSQPNQSLEWWDMETAVGRLKLWQRAGRVVVDYRAGYETIPADLKLAATELVAQAYQAGRQNSAVKFESLGNYSYTLATQAEISDALWSRLRLYMEIR